MKYVSYTSLLIIIFCFIRIDIFAQISENDSIAFKKASYYSYKNIDSMTYYYKQMMLFQRYLYGNKWKVGLDKLLLSKRRF